MNALKEAVETRLGDLRTRRESSIALLRSYSGCFKAVLRLLAREEGKAGIFANDYVRD